MAQDTTAIYEQVITIMKTHTEVDVAYSMDTNIAADLSIDSVAMFELISELEDHFDIGFSIEEASALATIGALVEAISDKIIP